MFGTCTWCLRFQPHYDPHLYTTYKQTQTIDARVTLLICNNRLITEKKTMAHFHCYSSDDKMVGFIFICKCKCFSYNQMEYCCCFVMTIFFFHWMLICFFQFDLFYIFMYVCVCLLIYPIYASTYMVCEFFFLSNRIDERGNTIYFLFRFMFM